MKAVCSFYEEKKRPGMFFANLPSIFQDVCVNGVTYSNENKHRLLVFLHAMDRCLGEFCDIKHRPNEQLGALLKKDVISDRDFCDVLRKMKNSLPVPRVTRHLEQNLKSYGLTMSDLTSFNTMQTEEEMFTEMKYIWEHVKNDKPKTSINTFQKVLATVFASQASLFTEEITTETKLSLTMMFMQPLHRVVNYVFGFEEISEGGFVLLLALNRQYPNEVVLSRKQKEMLLRRIRVDTLWSPNYDLEQLLEWINKISQLDATLPLPTNFFAEMDEILETHYAVRLRTLYSRDNDFYDNVAKAIVTDRYWNVVRDIIKYRDPTTIGKLVPSFPGLSEDIIALESIALGKESAAFLLKWIKLRKGIIARVWFSHLEPDDIEKVRSLLRFFPLPYVLRSNNVLPLLLERTECKDWAIRYDLGQSTESDAPTGCGCNCLCSTKMGFMIANEVGLLGKKIHVVRSPKHIYLAVGNRETDWVDRKVEVIETTGRDWDVGEIECTKPLMSLITLQNQALYSQGDYLLPNVHEFYMERISQIWRSEYASAIQSFLETFIKERSTNIFGVNDFLLLTKTAFVDRMAFLLQKEIDHPTLQQMHPENGKLNRVLREFNYLDLNVRNNLRILLARVNKDEMFGPQSELHHEIKNIVDMFPR
jgi:hypothetical protein